MTLIHPNNRLQDKRLNSKSVHNKGNQLVDARLPAHGLNCAQKSRSTTLYRISKLNLTILWEMNRCVKSRISWQRRNRCSSVTIVPCSLHFQRLITAIKLKASNLPRNTPSEPISTRWTRKRSQGTTLLVRIRVSTLHPITGKRWYIWSRFYARRRNTTLRHYSSQSTLLIVSCMALRREVNNRPHTCW